MNGTKLIGSHLLKYSQNLKLKIYNVNTICAFTNEHIEKGIKLSDLIKEKFVDYEFIKYISEYCSVESALLIEQIIPNQNNKLNPIRNYSFFCNENELTFLKREDLENILFMQKDTPFVLAITFSFKKHIAFKTTLNYSSNIYRITTDKGDVIVDMNNVKSIYPILQNWYTVVAGKEAIATKPTYFSKNDMLFGSTNFTKIDGYNGDYFKENREIEKYRGSLFLELLVHILNKKEHKENEI